MSSREVFTKDNRPPLLEYRRRFPVRAVRVNGPFECVTKDHGTVPCDDGYVAYDESAYPYPIGAEEFDKLYKPV